MIIVYRIITLRVSLIFLRLPSSGHINQPITARSIYGVKFSLREIRKVFSIKLRNFQLWKLPKLLDFRFPEEIFF